MAQLKNAFDSNQHEDIGSFDPVPAAVYTAAIVKSERKQTKKKNGYFYQLQFKILKGEYKGRFLWTRLNLENPNPIAVEIAQKELATICRAVNKRKIQDTQELHDKPMLIKVVVTAATKMHPESNEIKGYKSLTKKEEVEEVEDFEDVNEENSDTDEDLEIDDDDIPW